MELEKKSSTTYLYILGVITGLLVFYSNYLVFLVVPNERTMGPVQRILYFHVGSAFACYISAALVLAGGLWYLATREAKADRLAQAAGEVGLVFCSMVLFSGMIWGHSSWNTWFRWEPRLVTFLLLWFVFLSFNLLRIFGDRARIATQSAVLGIIGAVTVPLVVFSVYFLPNVPQLHPKEVVVGGLAHPAYKLTFWCSVFGLILLQFLLVWIRARLGSIEAQVEELKFNQGES
jgi:heme exporter protein C